MLLRPVPHILRAFFFESSASSAEDFYVCGFFQPLYVPSEDVHFTFGQRLSNRVSFRLWNEAVVEHLPNAMQEYGRVLMNISDADQVVRALEPLTRPDKRSFVNPNCLEALAYSLLLANRKTEAEEVIRKCLPTLAPEREWEQRIADRMSLIQAKVAKSMQSAFEVLAGWERDTIHNLKLEEVFAGLADPGDEGSAIGY